MGDRYRDGNRDRRDGALGGGGAGGGGDRRRGNERRDDRGAGGGGNRGGNDRNRGNDDRGAGGGHRGGGGGDGQHFQRSFVGSKRGRDADGGDGGSGGRLIPKLMGLGDRQQGAYEENLSDGKLFDEVVYQCRREIQSKPAQLLEILIECVTEVSTKTPQYVLLTGLLNVEEHEFVGQLLGAAVKTLDSALRGGDMRSARLLTRYLSALAAVNVVHASSVVAMLRGLVSGGAAAREGSADASGATWQPYADALVVLAISAIPWSGQELTEACGAEVAKLGDAINEYMELRPIKSDACARPFFSTGDAANADAAAASDSGSATHLPQLWAAVQACRVAGWTVSSIPQLHAPFEVKLATASAHALPDLVVPATPQWLSPDLSAPQTAAALRVTLPPRGGLRLLSTEHTEGSRAAIERFVAEDLLLDTLASYSANRVECVRKLVAGMPMPWPHRNLLAELLFAQLMTLPAPQLHPMAYCTVMVELCKIPKFEFPKALSACVRELFARVPVMAPELRGRVISWLSYHLSNFEYQWPWDRWAWVADEPPSHPQRQFVEQLLARLIRLSYWERISECVPEKLKPLVGAVPAVMELPAPREGGGGVDVDMAGGSGDAASTQMGDAVVAGELLTRLRAKASCQDALRWLRERVGGEGDAESARKMLRAAMLALLSAGSKSPSHLNAALERYDGLLEMILAECGGEDSAQKEMLTQAASFYAALPQKQLMVVDRLLALKLVTDNHVVAWALLSALPASGYGTDHSAAAAAFEALHFSVDRCLQAGPELRERVKREQTEVDVLRAKADAAARRAAAATEEAASAGAPPPPPAPTGDNSEGLPPLPLPPSLGDAAVRRALSRVEAAKHDERMLTSKFRDAELSLQSVREQLASSDTAAGALLMRAYGCLYEVLTQAEAEAAAAAGDDGEGEGAPTWPARLEEMYQQLRSFTRRYAQPSAAIAQALSDQASAAGVPARAAADVAQLLHLELLGVELRKAAVEGAGADAAGEAADAPVEDAGADAAAAAEAADAPMEGVDDAAAVQEGADAAAPEKGGGAVAAEEASDAAAAAVAEEGGDAVVAEAGGDAVVAEAGGDVAAAAAEEGGDKEMDTADG
ncbi:hypothetical protein FOA52_014452 [Chlamydomonas sp. UWO 241]|nr:hypothetical protein FOA52_014452 [Chlamydomonas sp. UWO 241]